MPERSFSIEDYRFGFQNQEKDDEIKGNSNSINFRFRIHDPRLGRFLSLDPLSKEFPFNSPYAFSENSLIAFIELEGLEKVFFHKSVSNNYKSALYVQRNTTIGQEFYTKFKKQSQYNVMYIAFESYEEGRTGIIEDISELTSKKSKFQWIQNVSEEAYSIASEGKPLMIIGIDKRLVGPEPDKLKKSAKTINHEEFHGLKILKGESDIKKDHGEYYGREAYYSPDAAEVQTSPEYKDSMAKDQFDQIDKIVDEGTPR